MTQTNITQSAVVVASTGALSLYDQIMLEIEPDLASGNYPEIVEWMKTESEEEKAERMRKYNAAFAECEKRMQEHMKNGKEALTHAKRQVLIMKEKKSLKEDSASLTKIENAFQAI